MDPYAALKNFVTKCITPNGPMPHQYFTDAGTRRDSIHTPLDYLIIAAKNREPWKFEFPVGGPAKRSSKSRPSQTRARRRRLFRKRSRPASRACSSKLLKKSTSFVLSRSNPLNVLFSGLPTGSPLPCLPFLDHHHFGRLDQRHGLITHLETQRIQGITRNHCRNLMLANVEIDLCHDLISFNS
jgi:hypothetical protein